MKKLNDLDTLEGLKNDVILLIPELLERIFYELKKTDRRLKKLEKKKLSK